jgi:hypothetical protein
MATYQVIQDIEAEDKFVGPFTFKQFGFAMVGVFFGFLCFTAAAKGAPWAMSIFGPPMFLGFFLAWPWSKDQPTEVWVLAKIRFRFKPKKRIWDQSGLEQLVTITAPKKEEKQLTNNLGHDEVQSRLKALAETIDSRGWAIKNSEINPGLVTDMRSDRLISVDSLPKEVPTIDTAGIQDVLGEDTAVSTNLEQMLEQGEQLRLKQNLDKMERIRHGEPLEAIKQPEIRFTPPPANYQTPFEQVPSTAVTDEEALATELKAKRAAGDIATSNMHAIGTYNPYAVTPAKPPVENEDQTDQAQASIPSAPTPAILGLASNNDLDVQTIARQAKKAAGGDDSEVVISLR